MGLGIAAILDSSAASHRTERFLGTGRACYGTLTISDKRISWLTPFSKCSSKAYQIVERDSGRMTFRLERASSACRYEFVSLVHHAGKNMDQGWEVMGYRDEPAYREHKASRFQANPEHMLSCYLIRDPDPTGPLDW